jgi:hypothetical protein
MALDTTEGNSVKIACSSYDTSQVIFFAAQIAGALDRDAAKVAQEKGWIDASGEVTTSGHGLLRAFREQAYTRSVFRPMC